jgi:cytochrome P450
LTNDHNKDPPRALSEYHPSKDLLEWMIDQFESVGDLYKAKIYGDEVYFVNDVNYIQSILRDKWRNYNKNTVAMKRIRMLTGNGIITSDGPLWKKHRRLMQPAFHSDVVSGLTDTIVKANSSLLKKWELAAGNKHSVNVTRDINIMILETVLVSVFGEDYPEIAPKFQVIAEESARNLEFAEAFRPLREVVTRVAAKRLVENTVATDILGLLVKARDRDSHQPMSVDEVVTQIMTLVVAGYETTSLTLAWAWYLLSKNLSVDAKLGACLKHMHVGEIGPQFCYIRQVINETLRLYPPIWVMVRRAFNGNFLGDYFIPARTEVYFSPYIIQRSPALWEAPDRFDPSRFDPDRSKGRHPFAMLPFGAGPRNCIGEGLAQFEMQIHLSIVAQKLRLRSDDASSPELETGVNLRPKRDFFMFPEFRN